MKPLLEWKHSCSIKNKLQVSGKSVHGLKTALKLRKQPLWMTKSIMSHKTASRLDFPMDKKIVKRTWTTWPSVILCCRIQLSDTWGWWCWDSIGWVGVVGVLGMIFLSWFLEINSVKMKTSSQRSEIKNFLLKFTVSLCRL